MAFAVAVHTPVTLGRSSATSLKSHVDIALTPLQLDLPLTSPGHPFLSLPPISYPIYALTDNLFKIGCFEHRTYTADELADHVKNTQVLNY